MLSRIGVIVELSYNVKSIVKVTEHNERTNTSGSDSNSGITKVTTGTTTAKLFPQVRQ